MQVRRFCHEDVMNERQHPVKKRRGNKSPQKEECMSKTSPDMPGVVISSHEVEEAVDFFLRTPSFSTKQRALELLLRKIYLDSMGHGEASVSPS